MPPPQLSKKCKVPKKATIFSINGKLIPVADELNTFRYLGHLFATSGINIPSLTNLAFWLGCIKRALLKPDQRLNIIRDHMIPQAVYGLQSTKIDGLTLKNVDKIIKAFT